MCLRPYFSKKWKIISEDVNYHFDCQSQRWAYNCIYGQINQIIFSKKDRYYQSNNHSTEWILIEKDKLWNINQYMILLLDVCTKKNFGHNDWSWCSMMELLEINSHRYSTKLEPFFLCLIWLYILEYIGNCRCEMFFYKFWQTNSHILWNPWNKDAKSKLTLMK